jgi:hypothetical protein
MMSAMRCAILAAAMTTLLASHAEAKEPSVELRRNPFDRPVAEVLTNNAAPASRDSTRGGEPFLRGVLTAGRNSVVNFGGVILQIGESVNGYRLLSVEEDQATFSRDGEKVVLTLYNPERAEDQ